MTKIILKYGNVTFGPENFLKTPILEETKMDFQVGDEVVDIILNKAGVVTEINDDTYPVIVTSINGSEYGYTHTGLYIDHDVIPRLYHKGTTFEINPAKPKRKKYINIFRNDYGYNIGHGEFFAKETAEAYGNLDPYYVKTIEVD